MIEGPAPLSLRLDDSITSNRVRPGTVRRILPYARPYLWSLVLLLTVTAADAIITVANPLILGGIIDDGILLKRQSVVIGLSSAIAGLALADALAVYVQTWCSARVGQGLICDLRVKVFAHVQQQSLAFFNRTQTGSLVSRLSTDINGAQQAVTTLLSQTVSAILTLFLVFVSMFLLSWQISIMALVFVPLFVLPGKLIGRRLQRLTREQMQLNADLSSMANEKFNVAGAMLTKLYGQPTAESSLFAIKAHRLRDITAVANIFGRTFFIVMALLAALTTALVYGLGGSLVIGGEFKIGTLVALIALLSRLYGPINQLSNMQVSLLTALVSFDRVFEVLDLPPLIAERPHAYALHATASDGQMAPDIEFDRVSFRYPAACEISLASLESITLPTPERADNAWVLHEVSFRAPAGKLTALVGPSGAGKTTISQLVPRLYDPGSGTIRIGGHDLRNLTLQSLNDTIGVVTQDSHLFHETIRANLMYGRPGATEDELIEACTAARIWDLISVLPNGLDTVAGDRGYRLSGGEKQRIALARLLLKAPSVVVLDEATAHLDSESEAAIQQALKTALAGRTSLVIAHRLSTVREADQILVINAGRIVQRGNHEKLLSSDGLYAELYHTQFAPQAGAREPGDMEGLSQCQ